MVVNFEFLDDEPIENIVTCLNYKIDKTVFFGYAEVIEKRRESMERFLKKYCGVSQVAFFSMSHTDLDSVIDMMRKQAKRERQQGNQVFFDITGGENLILVAFGILSGELNAPMHMYDIESGELIELNTKEATPISKAVEKRIVRLNLDSYIEMQGGVINYRLHKGLKSAEDEEFNRLIPKIWDVAKENASAWNSFSAFLKQYGSDEDDGNSLWVNLRIKGKNVNAPQGLQRILSECADYGILVDMRYQGDECSFRYRDDAVKDCLLDAGSILELHTFMQEKEKYTDCRVGVHLDWDGFIHEKTKQDVLNEVDVLALDGYVPVFMSCKNGHVDKEALYELDSVAGRFGGKYARKILVATKGLWGTDGLRAEEMKIEVKLPN